MIGAIDVETYEEQGDIYTPVLDTRQFVLGCLLLEGHKKAEFFTDPLLLWHRVLDLGRRLRKHNKSLTLYSHNAAYDFYSYADITDERLSYSKSRPFITTYTIDGRRTIWFVDSMNFYPMSLKQVGEIIGRKKTELPGEAKDITELKPYCENDTRIVLESIQYIKWKLAAENITVRRLLTMNQIANRYFVNTVRQNPKCANMFYDQSRGRFKWSSKQNNVAVHMAYRGGRNEAWQTGEWKRATMVDVNNLYGYCSTRIRFPNLQTERRLYKPLRLYAMEDVLKYIGVSRVAMRNVDNDLGLLPVRRVGYGNHYPTAGKQFIGTYTHLELQKALREGYEIEDIEWSIIWEDDAYNPFSTITPRLYTLRKQSKNAFDSMFYKQLQNCCYGKLAQKNKTVLYKLDAIAKRDKYLQEGYTETTPLGLRNLYRKEEEATKPKDHYIPIVPTLINAQARVVMYDYYKKVPKKDLLYTDTDSIIFTGNHLAKFSVNTRLGGFKVQGKNKPCVIHARKTYRIGDAVKIAGTPRRHVTPASFDTGMVQTSRMRTLKTAQKQSEVGTFTQTTRNLRRESSLYNETKQQIEKEKIYIDQGITDTSYFRDFLLKV